MFARCTDCIVPTNGFINQCQTFKLSVKNQKWTFKDVKTDFF